MADRFLLITNVRVSSDRVWAQIITEYGGIYRVSPIPPRLELLKGITICMEDKPGAGNHGQLSLGHFVIGQKRKNNTMVFEPYLSKVLVEYLLRR